MKDQDKLEEQKQLKKERNRKFAANAAGVVISHIANHALAAVGVGDIVSGIASSAAGALVEHAGNKIGKKTSKGD